MVILNRVILCEKKPFLRNENSFRWLDRVGPFDFDNWVTHLKCPSVHHVLHRLARFQSSLLVSHVRQGLPQIVLKENSNQIMFSLVIDNLSLEMLLNLLYFQLYFWNKDKPVLRFRICASLGNLWFLRWKLRGRGSLPSCGWRTRPCRRRCCRRSQWSRRGGSQEQISGEKIEENL